MRDEDILDTLYSIREYLDADADISAEDPEQGNKAMLLMRDLDAVIRSLGGE